MDIGHHHPYYPDPDILAIEDLLDFSNEEDISTNHHNHNHNHNSPIEQTPLLPFTNAISSSSSSSSCSSSCSSSIIFSSSLPHNPSLHPTPPPILEKKLSLAAFDASFVPCDESAELEWLSNFVEESFSSSCGQSAHNSGTDCPGTLRSFGDEASGQMSAQSSFLGDEMSGQMPSRRRGRPRTKRHRTTPACFWNSRILSEDASESIILESSYSTTTSTTTNTTITATSSDSDMFSTYYDHDDDDDNDEADNDEAEDDDNEEEEDDVRPCERVFKPSSNANCREGKKFRKLEEPDRRGKITKASKLEKAKAQDEAAVRKCLHCATQKTPQWRAGPMGPKTLCNACGVRYKSGRLCPEYRPSASPTFNENVHSNSHRRVIEMRRQKGELIDPNSSGPARERLERASNVHD